jgi:hypothetical protein
LVLDESLGCAESNLLRFFPLQKRDPFPGLAERVLPRAAIGAAGTMDPLTTMIGLPSQVSPVLPVGRDVPRDGRLLSSPGGECMRFIQPTSFRHLWRECDNDQPRVATTSFPLQGLVARN